MLRHGSMQRYGAAWDGMQGMALPCLLQLQVGVITGYAGPEAPQRLQGCLAACCRPDGQEPAVVAGRPFLTAACCSHPSLMQDVWHMAMRLPACTLLIDPFSGLELVVYVACC